MPDPLPRHSGRTLLRRLSISDLSQFQAYRTDPEVGRYQGWSAISSADADAFLSKMAVATLFQPDQWFQLGIADSRTNRLIGDIGVCVRSGRERIAEIGFTLAPSWQRQGLGTEAVGEAVAMIFEYARADYVIAITDTRNLPSIGLLKKVGMSLKETVESTFRGEPCTEHIFEIRRHPFRRKRL
ncbi:MAG: GNAT family N-acetyltransferase [Burkholderiales bacterium]